MFQMGRNRKDKTLKTARFFKDDVPSMRLKLEHIYKNCDGFNIRRG